MENLDNDGWEKVRHLPPGNKMFKATDKLLGTSVYGTYLNEFEEWSIKFDDKDCSDYIKSQYQLLVKLFVKHNQYFFFMHGDLHKGNWKVKDDGRIIIYDFGYCWKSPKYLQDSFQKIDKAFLDIDDENKE